MNRRCQGGHTTWAELRACPVCSVSWAAIIPPERPPPLDTLESMRRDAARYEWLRENWPELVTTVGQEGTIRVVYRIAASAPAPDTPSFDPQTLDQAIDSAMDAEEFTSDYMIEAIERGENNG